MILYARPMEQINRRRAKKGVANFFGALGYFFSFLQWFWVVMLYFSVLQAATLFVSPNADKPVEPPALPNIAIPTSVEWIILGITVVVMVGVTIYALIKIPMSIVKTSNKVVHKTAQSMAPVVIKAQHKKETKKLRDMLSTRLVIILKLFVVLVPIGLAAASAWLDKHSVDYSIALIVSFGLASLSTIFFALQYAMAGALRVKLRDLW